MLLHCKPEYKEASIKWKEIISWKQKSRLMEKRVGVTYAFCSCFWTYFIERLRLSCFQLGRKSDKSAIENYLSGSVLESSFDILYSYFKFILLYFLITADRIWIQFETDIFFHKITPRISFKNHVQHLSY